MRNHRPRLDPTAYRGLVRCFLTYCTAQRTPHFTAPRAVNLVLEQILRTAAEYHVAIPAYCFMPDHVHLLACGDDENADIARFTRIGKQRSGHEFAVREGGRLWQPSYFDRLLRADEDTWGLVRYIVENPVRAGLAREPREYALLGSGMYPLEALIEAAYAPGVREWRWQT